MSAMVVRWDTMCAYGANLEVELLENAVLGVRKYQQVGGLVYC